MVPLIHVETSYPDKNLDSGQITVKDLAIKAIGCLEIAMAVWIIG